MNRSDIAKTIALELKQNNLPPFKESAEYFYLQGNALLDRTKKRRVILSVCETTSSIHAFCLRGTTHNLFDPYLLHVSSASFDEYQAVLNPVIHFLVGI